MTHQFNKTILIVCEGEGTEPNYFDAIRDTIIDKGLPIKITISPMPKSEKEQLIQIRSGAKKRLIKNVSISNEAKAKEDEIPELYKAQPLRYVWQALKGLEEGTYTEVWAVFDKNGHPKHKEAFELAQHAINGKRVNISFSSISFEYWVLLHFEQINYAFRKSQCREGDIILNCGTKTHQHDCYGTTCVCGYLIVNNYLPDNPKCMAQLYKKLLPNLEKGLNNAYWLREQVLAKHKEEPIYHLNPYIDTDKLVLSLLMLPIELHWFNKGVLIETDDIAFKIERQSGIVRVFVKNLKSKMYILNSGSFKFVNSRREFQEFNERQILKGIDEISIEVHLDEIQNGFYPIYIAHETLPGIFYITDL